MGLWVSQITIKEKRLEDSHALISKLTMNLQKSKQGGSGIELEKYAKRIK